MEQISKVTRVNKISLIKVIKIITLTMQMLMEENKYNSKFQQQIKAPTQFLNIRMRTFKFYRIRLYSNRSTFNKNLRK